jgi:hypothetical protein
MKRRALAFLGLLFTTACGSGTTGEAGRSDASADAALLDGGDAGSCANQPSPPTSLECTGLYSNFATKELDPNAVAYTPSSVLWSDGAQKQRWIELPPNTQIDISNEDEWTFPVGTKFFKEFRIAGKRVETRLYQKTKSDYWAYATYAWNADDSAATINYGGNVDVPGTDGGVWNIPTNDDCDECHKGRQDRVLGFDQVGLGLFGAQGLTLAQLVAQGLVTPAPAADSLTIGDDGTGLNALTMGWIHVNCGVTCHNSNASAAGNGAGMLLRLHASQLDGTPPTSSWDILNTTLGVPCVSGGLAGETRIIPGNPADSVIYQLIDERGTLQMPPIGSQLIDVPDVAIVKAWIAAMGASNEDGGMAEDGGEDAGERDAGHFHHDAGEEDSGVRDSGPDSTLPGDDSGANDGAVADAEVDAGEDAGGGDAAADVVTDGGTPDGAADAGTD